LAATFDALDKRRGHRRREVHHLEPLAADPDLIEDLADAIGAFARAQIALEEVTAAFQTPGHQHAGPRLERLQHVLRLMAVAGPRRWEPGPDGRNWHTRRP